MSKITFKILIILFLLLAKQVYTQNTFDEYLSKDSIYRFTSSLKVLDSLLLLQKKDFDIDTSFYNTFANAESINLNQLLFFTISNNPDLKSFETRVEAFKYQAEEKSYLPDPMFEFELDDIMSDFKRVGMINFFVSQMFPFPGKLALEKQSVLNNMSMLESEILVMSIEKINMIKMSYYDLYLINKKIQINQDNQLLVKTFSAATEIQYSVGKGMQQEIFKSQIEMSKLKNEEFLLKQQRKNIFSQLTALTKIIIDENTRIDFSDINFDYLLNKNSFNITERDQVELIDFAFEHRPDLKILENKIFMNKTELEIAKLNRYPDFNIKLGYKLLPSEEKNAFAFMIGINIPFAPWSSGKYSNSVSKNEIIIKSTSDEFIAKKNDIRAEIVNIINNIRSSKETMNYYYAILLPQTENTLKSTQYSYENNETDFLDLLDSYKMYQEARIMYYESVNMYLKMIAELEKATAINLKN
ncbi:MAG TPA: TolC family protein [Ignavibacteria bacterium]|nr:TolC family protein [Ignavibacteria bacterium]